MGRKCSFNETYLHKLLTSLPNWLIKSSWENLWTTQSSKFTYCDGFNLVYGTFSVHVCYHLSSRLNTLVWGLFLNLYALGARIKCTNLSKADLQIQFVLFFKVFSVLCLKRPLFYRNLSYHSRDHCKKKFKVLWKSPCVLYINKPYHPHSILPPTPLGQKCEK